MDNRLAASKAALQSGDPKLINGAAERVIAFGLQQIGELRMVEGAFSQAVDLYQQSTSFEDVPYKHLRLALAYLQLKKPDDALGEAEKVLFSEPGNAIAWRLEGSAWMQQKQYDRAAEALAHSLKLRGDTETAYNLAICFLAAKKKDRAELVFQDIAKNLGNTGNVHLMFGRAYREQDYPDDAEREFRKAIAIDPSEPHAHYFLGLLLLMRNEWVPTPEVRALFQQELELNGRDYLANYLLGMFASGEKQYEVSDRYLTIAAQGFSDWPEPPLYMGLNAYGRGDYGKAEALIRKAIQITGSNESRSDYDIRRGYIALGRIELATGRRGAAEADFAKSRQLLDTALKASQQNVSRILASEGSTPGMGAVVPLLEKGQEQQAIPDVSFARASDEFDLSKAKLSNQEKQQAEQEEKYLRTILGSSFNDLGTSEARTGDYASAFEHFRQAIDWEADTPGANRNLGVAAFKIGNYQAAIPALSNQVKADPKDISARQMLGLTYFSSHAYREAARTFSSLRDAATNQTGIAYPWAASLAEIGETQKSAAILNALETRQLPPDTLLLVGQTWSQIGDYARAIDDFHRALSIDPSLAKAHYNAGLARIYQGRPTDAEAEFEAELKLSPDDNDSKYNLAYAYLLQSERDKSVDLLRTVVAADPDHADAQYQLGKILLEEGKIDEATRHLEQAERAAPEKDYIHYQLQAAYRKAARLQDADRELALYKQAKARTVGRKLPLSSESAPPQ
ncbi:MAG TPA: tetratricopeptide repeat protein [Terriglobales bacterium]|nr:tetratricopeptide repeat protein [Terriglobales bacterium]